MLRKQDGTTKGLPQKLVEQAISKNYPGGDVSSKQSSYSASNRLHALAQPKKPYVSDSSTASITAAQVLAVAKAHDLVTRSEPFKFEARPASTLKPKQRHKDISSKDAVQKAKSVTYATSGEAYRSSVSSTISSLASQKKTFDTRQSLEPKVQAVTSNSRTLQHNRVSAKIHSAQVRRILTPILADEPLDDDTIRATSQTEANGDSIYAKLSTTPPENTDMEKEKENRICETKPLLLQQPAFPVQVLEKGHHADPGAFEGSSSEVVPSTPARRADPVAEAQKLIELTSAMVNQPIVYTPQISPASDSSHPEVRNLELRPSTTVRCSDQEMYDERIVSARGELEVLDTTIPPLNVIDATVHPVCRKSDEQTSARNNTLPIIKYYTDQGFRPLLCAFRNFQWRDFANRGKWNMFWGNVANVRNLFQPGQRYYFNDDQLANHYQTCYQLSRKDNMTKNIKKYRSELAHAKDPLGKKDQHGNFQYLDLIAPTYLLPFDFNAFVDEFRKSGGLYIIKPCSGSQGQGIFLVNQLDQAKRWQERALAEIAQSVQDNEAYQGYLISRYISNPLLIDGKKFDLRLYVLVTSFKPLRCYYYKQGFCRFCATKYSPDGNNIDDKFMHLTNVAVQKQKKGYNRSHGNKWNITAFRLYMERVHGRGKMDSLFDNIFWMIVQSLKAAQPLMDNDRHCYEMYGYDCLIDANLKPWLLEINASPSLEDSTPTDRIIKTNLLMDTMRLAVYERCPHLLGIKEKSIDGSDMPLGDYEILYLEEQTLKSVVEKKTEENTGRYGPATGPLKSSKKPRWKNIV